MIKSDKINSRGIGRPPVPDYIKNAVVVCKQKHPDWSAKKILNEIHRVLFNNYKDKHPDWSNEKIEANIKLPCANTVNKKILPKKPPDKCMVKEWQLSLADKYKITPEALFYISQVQYFCERVKENPDPPFGKYSPIPVRQALWIAKLYTFIPYFVAQWRADKKIHQSKLKDWCLISLYRWSKVYAEYKEICEQAKTDYDTHELDKGLRSGAIPIIGGPILKESVAITKNGAVILFYYPEHKIRILSPEKDFNKNFKDGEK